MARKARVGLPLRTIDTMRRLLSIPVCAALALAACSGGDDSGRTLYSAFRHVDAGAWRYTDTLVFPLAGMTDTVPRHGDLVVTVRHSNDYDYSNIWLEVELPGGDTRSVCMELADVYGRWYGRGMGLTFERTDTLLRGITLGPADTLRLHHNMRADTLRAVEQVGVFFVGN